MKGKALFHNAGCAARVTLEWVNELTGRRLEGGAGVDPVTEVPGDHAAGASVTAHGEGEHLLRGHGHTVVGRSDPDEVLGPGVCTGSAIESWASNAAPRM